MRSIVLYAIDISKAISFFSRKNRTGVTQLTIYTAVVWCFENDEPDYIEKGNRIDLFLDFLPPWTQKSQLYLSKVSKVLTYGAPSTTSSTHLIPRTILYLKQKCNRRRNQYPITTKVGNCGENSVNNECMRWKVLINHCFHIWNIHGYTLASNGKKI